MSRAGRRTLLTTLLLTAGVSVALAAPAAADTTDAGPVTEPAPQETAVPGEPMPVREGAFGYLATRDATLWLAGQRPGNVVKALPAPPAYQDANRALGERIDSELRTASTTPGACVQIVVDPEGTAGALFDYGVFAVDAQYCP